MLPAPCCPGFSAPALTAARPGVFIPWRDSGDASGSGGCRPLRRQRGCSMASRMMGPGVLRRLALAACLATTAALSAPAETVSEPAAILQLYVDQIRSGAAVTIGSETVASTVVLPEFYEGRGFRPAWTDGATRADLLTALRASAGDGLDPRDYHLDAIEALSRTRPGAQTDADLDLLATDAVIRLAYHLRFGKVDLATIEPDWAFQPDEE